MAEKFTNKDFQELQHLLFPYIFNIVHKKENKGRKGYHHFLNVYKNLNKLFSTPQLVESFGNCVVTINYTLLDMESNTEREKLILHYSQRFFDFLKEEKNITVRLIDEMEWTL